MSKLAAAAGLGSPSAAPGYTTGIGIAVGQLFG
jgi:hypothetical protein